MTVSIGYDDFLVCFSLVWWFVLGLVLQNLFCVVVVMYAYWWGWWGEITMTRPLYGYFTTRFGAVGNNVAGVFFMSIEMNLPSLMLW